MPYIVDGTELETDADGYLLEPDYRDEVVPVIAQAELPVHPDDTPDTLAARLLPMEHRLLAACVDSIARGRIALGSAGVELDGVPLAAPLRLQIDGSLRTA